MKTLLLVLSLAVMGVGCDGDPNTDNGQVTVENRTDKPITVVYEREDVTARSDCDCDGHTDITIGLGEHHAHIDSHHEATLTVDSYGWWDGDITVEYDGLWRTYDVDFDLFGFDTVEVHADDFVPVGNG